jgi:hypothetical protein
MSRASLIFILCGSLVDRLVEWPKATEGRSHRRLACGTCSTETAGEGVTPPTR